MGPVAVRAHLFNDGDDSSRLWVAPVEHDTVARAVAAHVVLTVFVNALILQRMALTIRSVEFPVPGGLGMQESGYVLVDNFLGISGEPPLLSS